MDEPELRDHLRDRLHRARLDRRKHSDNPLASGKDPEAPDWYRPGPVPESESAEDASALTGDRDEHDKERDSVHSADTSPKDDSATSAATLEETVEEAAETPADAAAELPFSTEPPSFMDWREELRERLKKIRAKRLQEESVAEISEPPAIAEAPFEVEAAEVASSNDIDQAAGEEREIVEEIVALDDIRPEPAATGLPAPPPPAAAAASADLDHEAPELAAPAGQIEEPQPIEDSTPVVEPQAIEEPGPIEEPPAIEEPGPIEEPPAIEEPEQIEEPQPIEDSTPVVEPPLEITLEQPPAVELEVDVEPLTQPEPPAFELEESDRELEESSLELEQSGLELDLSLELDDVDDAAGPHWDHPVAIAPPQPTASAISRSTGRPGLRTAAALCDALILLGLGGALLAVAGAATGASLGKLLRESLLPLSLVWGIFAVGYSVFFVGTCGQTIGKMVMQLRVVSEDHFTVGFQRAVMRLAAYLVAILPLGLGLLPALKDPRGRALHDRLTRTRVVKA
ncbi:MAG: RDD family protein [Acidobacteriota bacterium]